MARPINMSTRAILSGPLSLITRTRWRRDGEGWKYAATYKFSSTDGDGCTFTGTVTEQVRVIWQGVSLVHHVVSAEGDVIEAIPSARPLADGAPLD